MQVQKEDIRQEILKQAQKEFLTHGFAKASMRRISRMSKIAVSNMYNYFENKDAIFEAIVAPVTDCIEKKFREMETVEMYRDPYKWSYQWHYTMLSSVAEFIDTNRSHLCLIAFKSHGSSLENYRNDLIERYTEISMNYIKNAKSVYPGIQSDISEFSVHNITSLTFNIMTEILMHNVGRKEMMKCFSEMMTFMFYGFEGLMQYDFDKMKPLHRKRK